MPKRCILHIGAHKTGSSAFQLWTVENAETLSQSGIAIPLAMIGKTGNGSRLSQVLTASRAERTAEQKAMGKEFKHYVKAQGDKTVLVSAEHFESSLGQGRFPDLAKFLHKAGFKELVAVLILRNQADLINSSYVQRIKSFKNADDFSAGDSAERNSLDWAKQVDRLHAAGFQDRVGVYDGPAASETISGRIFRLAGLQAQVPASLSYATPMANPSIGEIGVLACRALYPLLMQLKGEQKINGISAIKRNFAIASAKIGDRTFNGFDAADLDKLEATFAASNSRVSAALSPEEAARLMTSSARKRPKSPQSLAELDDSGRERLAVMMHDIADAMAKMPRLSKALSRDAILDSVRT